MVFWKGHLCIKSWEGMEKSWEIMITMEKHIKSWGIYSLPSGY